MPFNYQDFLEEGSSWGVFTGGEHLSERREKRTADTDTRPKSAPPKLVKFAKKIISGTSLRSSASPQAESANASQKPPVQGKSQATGSKATNTASKKGKEKMERDETTPNELLNEVKEDEFEEKLWRQEARVPLKRSRTECMTAPECSTCGTKLSLDQIMNPGGPCLVCHM